MAGKSVGELALFLMQIFSALAPLSAASVPFFHYKMIKTAARYRGSRGALPVTRGV